MLTRHTNTALGPRNMAGNYNTVDLFAGVGGLSLGFKKSGFKTIFANDIDKYAGETFMKNQKKVPFYLGDIAELRESDIKKYINKNTVHVLMGGIPCQSFSMAGYRIRKGIDNSEDPRHFLYKEFFRVLDKTQPAIAIIENVKGIVSSNGGLILNEIMNSFTTRGYKVDYKLLDASKYGVPQIRQRVFIVATNLNTNIIFPKEVENTIPVGDILKDIPETVKNHEKRFLTGKSLERALHLLPGQNWKYLPEHLQTKSIHSGAYGRIDPTIPARTITTRFDTPSVGFVTHPVENRTLTVREGARIQTFPDDFIFYGPKMSQFKQVGNAVPVKLAYEVSKGIKKMLNTAYGNRQ